LRIEDPVEVPVISEVGLFSTISSSAFSMITAVAECGVNFAHLCAVMPFYRFDQKAYIGEPIDQRTGRSAQTLFQACSFESKALEVDEIQACRKG
jgi:hypothetical protein